ncbi:transcription factor bHLH153 [Musa acuminata AAA Group]
MMMMTEVADHKRASHDGFVLRDMSGSSRSHNDSSGGKRPKTSDGGRGAATSTKEKDRMGERVAKLQQLVSPFGKSDTASVLSEATAYIKFLHEQLQVLCAPYLRKAVTGKMEGDDHYSLRSRGLCLVPLSSTFQIARSNGADLWAPVNTNRKP